MVKGGNLEYLHDLFDRYNKRIFNYFLKSTLHRGDSEDLAQDLFIRVMKYRNSYREGNAFEVWIFQIARNMVKDHFRKMRIHKDHFSVVEEMPELLEKKDDSLEREKQLYDAMNSLPEEKRELLVLTKFSGMKYEQVAEMKNTTVGNIKVQVHRTIKELKDIYFTVEEE